MAQKTFVDGDVLPASDINTYLMGEGGAWTSFTPQVDQGASTNIAKTVNYSNYARYGRTIHFAFGLAMTAAGTAGSQVTITLPVTAASTSGLAGSARVFDTSTNSYYSCTIMGPSTTTIAFQFDTSGTAARWGLAPNLALASGDTIVGQITYEAAS
jgi:hypothetical protein